jgi:2'-5' RNA ligase
MKDPLFFIALMPGEDIQQEVTAFKQHCAQYFGASHSLTSPPHITLVPPFAWAEAQLPALKDALSGFAPQQFPFDVNLRDFGCFPPRVIFVDIVPNPALVALAERLTIYLDQEVGLRQTSSHGFNPHMTVAHRDLQKQVFPAAWAYFSKLEYRRSFPAKGLTLLRHEKGRWEVEASFFFLK